MKSLILSDNEIKEIADKISGDYPDRCLAEACVFTTHRWEFINDVMVRIAREVAVCQHRRTMEVVLARNGSLS